ncbi:TadE/TadG family type IV pilus assembly protein [Methylobacillus flagellatus]|uniref:TadE-like protein n=1 Tax=Methylobacillus flagellatus (strain ATCC 51484 / DSM 6875 / VKM B-1610 / KT) TaxID=265072 RepID=Q1H0S5_METFK|nr:TadE/TadG family type IV pilus assembly protein [Methylobacillus flagellatus]ABE49912.1 TadE-like protein [Methylobacillus flagellatus KT]
MASITDILNRHVPKRRQSGAAAIEFAMLFMLFFTLFYALVTYAIVFLLQSSFIYAASEGARSAIAVDPMTSSNVGTAITARVRGTVGNTLAWLPDNIRERVLGDGNSNVMVDMAGNSVTVRVVYPNYITNPVIPILNIPGYGPMLPMPLNLQGNASINLA